MNGSNPTVLFAKKCSRHVPITLNLHMNVQCIREKLFPIVDHKSIIPLITNVILLTLQNVSYQ